MRGETSPVAPVRVVTLTAHEVELPGDDDIDPWDDVLVPAGAEGIAPDDARWGWLWSEPESVRQAESLSGLGEEYSKVKIKVKAAQGADGAGVAYVTAYHRTRGWEPVDLPAEYQKSLADIGIGVAAEEATSLIGACLRAAATPLDWLADAATVMLAPETLVPKVLGIVTEGLARHAGMPGFVARWAGEAVEQAVSPAFEPGGVRGEVLAGLEDFAVICDVRGGQVTSAVVGLAVDRLAGELKKRAGR